MKELITHIVSFVIYQNPNNHSHGSFIVIKCLPVVLYIIFTHPMCGIEQDLKYLFPSIFQDMKKNIFIVLSMEKLNF